MYGEGSHCHFSSHSQACLTPLLWRGRPQPRTASLTPLPLLITSATRMAGIPALFFLRSRPCSSPSSNKTHPIPPRYRTRILAL
ncbi:MAG: hypothetical protein ACJAQT_001678 [Akkermansiaceae bacterium]|jgi:hypothetical protein